MNEKIVIWVAKLFFYSRQRFLERLNDKLQIVFRSFFKIRQVIFRENPQFKRFARNERGENNRAFIFKNYPALYFFLPLNHFAMNAFFMFFEIGRRTRKKMLDVG